MDQCTMTLAPRRVALLAGIALALGGCNIVGPLGYLVGGDPKVKPQFTLTPERKTVVFIDDRASVLPNRATRDRIAQAAQKALADEKLVRPDDLIPAERLLPVITAERFGRPSGIVEVGEAVGADVVIYATLDAFSLSPDGSQFAPVASFRVKVLDIKNKKRLFPTGDQEWCPVTITPKVRPENPPKTLGERTAAERTLAEQTGLGVARVFFEYDPKLDERRIGR